jgi:regulator of cell morphogenesis and NO signaling
MPQAAPQTTLGAQVPATSGPAAALIDLILETHHARARELLERMERLVPGVVAAAGSQDSRLPKVREALTALNDEMLAHMTREERVLFPLIKELEELPEVSEADTGALLSPVVCMKREHNFIDEILAELALLTDNFAPPDWASADHRTLLSDLAAFEADTREHVRKENDELFPMAMEMAPPVR